MSQLVILFGVSSLGSAFCLYVADYFVLQTGEKGLVPMEDFIHGGVREFSKV